MLNFIKTLLLFVLVLCLSNDIFAIIIANPADVHLSIEDGEMQQAIITKVKFDGEDIDISNKNFMNRKINKVLYVSPGQYKIEWETEKFEKPWGGRKEVKKHRKIIIIELTDAVVYINIRGEALTTY